MPFLLLSSSSRIAIGMNTSCSSKRKRLVGSCMSTFVSSTKSLVEEGKRATLDAGLRWIMNLPDVVIYSSRLQCFDEFEHLLRMSGDFHAAPLAPHGAVGADHEGTAFDPAHFFTIHVFHLDDTEKLARDFFRVGEKLEGEAHLGLEAFVRLQAVARYAV